VAKRAGVGKTAIYRRWPSKQAMVVDLVASAAVGALVPPDTGTLHGDVRGFLAEAERALRHPLVARIVPDLIAEATRNPELRAVLLTAVRDPRRASAASLVHRAAERGELPADVDVERALDCLAGPLYFRLCVIRTPTETGYLDRLADQVVAAMAA
jgi:AcrR family transcriptional regulator